jgi:serine/threonine protein kinase
VSRSSAGDESRTGTLSTDPPVADGIRPGALSEALHDVGRQRDRAQGTGWPTTLEPGAVIGRFELLREVGQGGFGVVYEARDRELGRLVAFKAVRAVARRTVHEERLLCEAETAARLSHPNIVTLFDAGRAPQGPYLVMELLHGCTLARRPDPGPVPVREALRIVIEVAKGLAHAHAHGVVHRDLTPGNIFLCEDGQVKVLDLGLAHAFGHRKIDGGTPSYMAPEQRRCAPEDERTDVFAMGVILFELLTDELPFPADAGKMLPDPATAPSVDVPGLPAFAEFLAQMLSIDPVHRPRDAGEVLAALTNVAQEAEREPTADLRPRVMPVHQLAKRSGELPKSERTCVCSVLSSEIVKCSEQSVEIQARWKARFHARLRSAIRGVPEADRVVLDSGGSVVICFLGDPEAAISGAFGLLGSVTREDASSGVMRVRAGLHLGPVKLVKNTNGNLNALGEGLSVAHRTMTFAHENQVLASRSFHEVASCLSAAYQPLFAHVGVRRDELMHEHVLYELRPPGAATRRAEATHSSSEGSPPSSMPMLDAEVEAAIEGRAVHILGPIAHHLARTFAARTSSPCELAEALAAFMPQSGERAAFLRSYANMIEPRGTSGPTSSPVMTFSAAVLERAARRLAEYLGPMARILVSRTSQNARSEEELYDLLAMQIDSPKDRAVFRGKGPAPRQRH